MKHTGHVFTQKNIIDAWSGCHYKVRCKQSVRVVQWCSLIKFHVNESYKKEDITYIHKKSLHFDSMFYSLIYTDNYGMH